MKSVYIHIPFCNNICSYCDFSKMFYYKNNVSKYLDSLETEIINNYKNNNVKSIYIGGGTPSCLSYKELNRLLNIINIFKKSNSCEFTIEWNPEDNDIKKIELLKKYGVNRISIGVQSFNKKILKILNRNHTKKNVSNLINNFKKNGINNINIDLMFGINKQNIFDIKKDLKKFIKLNITHISYYSLILEKNTKLYIDNYAELDDDKQAKQYEYICKFLKKHKYKHYEISNFSKEIYESIHNLTYWNNEEYYGFGLGAHGYINGYRYENTRSINKYISGSYILNKYKVSNKENIENEVILGLRKLEGINTLKFKNKFNCNFFEKFNCNNLLEQKMLIKEDNRVFIPEDKIFISNDILINFIDGVDYE